MSFDGGRILWPLLLWLIPVLLFTTPAAAAGNHASSASSWILIGIAFTLVVEAGATYVYGRSAMRALRDAWSNAAALTS